jgi:DNA excision repair protein ERCC-4
MLPYENQMFLDVLHADGLVVAAKGLGLDHVFYSLLRVYSDPGNLVLVMGTTEAEEEHFTQRLIEDGRHGPKKITAEFSSAERQKLYLNGGVLFVTTRILCVDMLTDRLPIHLVTGILVYKAHYAAASCQETFIVRLYRQKNKTGFIKAFSSSPVAFKSNLCPVERAMRNLFLRNLYLWPRFHADVKTCLSECTTDVVELHVNMSPSMTTIQTAGEIV